MVASTVINTDTFLMAELHESSELQCHDISIDPLDQTRYKNENICNKMCKKSIVTDFMLPVMEG